MRFPDRPPREALEGRTIFGEPLPPSPTPKRPAKAAVGPNSAKEKADAMGLVAGKAVDPPYDGKNTDMLVGVANPGPEEHSPLDDGKPKRLSGETAPSEAATGIPSRAPRKPSNDFPQLGEYELRGSTQLGTPPPGRAWERWLEKPPMKP